MLKACKIRLYPNNEQKQIIASQADVVGALNILDRGIHGNSACLKIAS